MVVVATTAMVTTFNVATRMFRTTIIVVVITTIIVGITTIVVETGTEMDGDMRVRQSLEP
jgi:hypothetical protein